MARLVTETYAASASAVCAGSMRRAEQYVSGAGSAGRWTRDEGAPLASLSTVYDLASVTKPLVALTFARLERRGVLRRDELLGDVLSFSRGTPSATVPLDLFLAHRGGLQAHIELFAPLRIGGTVDRAASMVVAAESRRAELGGGPAPVDGFPPVYSDMSYLLVGEAISVRAGAPLDEVVAAEILAPLGLSGRIGSARLLRRADVSFDERVAPTEVVAFRGGEVRGVVHDENAFALVGDGLCGHAGLFGDAVAVRRVGEEILAMVRGESDLLTPEEIEPLVRSRSGGSLLAGFDRKSGETPSAGTRTGPNTFGHLGFTGTSLWIDPDAGFVGVLLTNRVHPTREHIAIRSARPAAYDAMYDLLA